MSPAYYPDVLPRTAAEVDCQADLARARTGWGFGAFTALFSPALDRVLFVQLGEYAAARHGGRPWTLPGGAVEPGELPSAAAAREVEEECGLVVRPEELVPVGWFPRPYFQGRWEKPGEVVVLFAARLPGLGGTPNGRETMVVVWHDADFDQLAAVPPEGTGGHPLQPLPRHWYHWARLAHRALQRPDTPVRVYVYTSAAAMAEAPGEPGGGGDEPRV